MAFDFTSLSPAYGSLYKPRILGYVRGGDRGTELGNRQAEREEFSELGQRQRLAQLAQQDALIEEQQMQREQFELAKRQKEKEEYAKWEREQILSAATSELFSKRGTGTYIGKDSKGNKMYQDTPLSQAEQYIAAAKKAAEMGKGAYAQEFMATAQGISQKEQKARLDAEQTRLENEYKQKQIEAKSRDDIKPSITELVDPLNPSRMIKVDATKYNEEAYRAGSTEGVIGTSGKEPTAAKKEEEASLGEEALADSINTLRGYYRTLDEKGAIVNPERNALANVGASIGASGIGQLAGGIIGTESQTIRDNINMQRPLLLQAIKQATGMTAKQMDSNAELKLWLNAATDPTKSISANMEALDSIERKYLNKGSAEKATASGESGNKTSKGTKYRVLEE